MPEKKVGPNTNTDLFRPGLADRLADQAGRVMKVVNLKLFEAWAAGGVGI